MGKDKCLKLFANKEFGAIRIGRRYFVSEENLKKFLSSGKKIWKQKEDLNLGFKSSHNRLLKQYA